MPVAGMWLNAPVGFHIAGIPVEFFIFGLTLVGIALSHKHALGMAVAGLILVAFYKMEFLDFSLTRHILGGGGHEGEWNILLNLLGLLLGFAILADYFEHSRIPDHLPDYLPAGWAGGLVFLFSIFLLSTFLDNIAAAMIGGTMAQVVFRGKVHLAFLVGIVAASNAGGAGSVLGDTTTTIMWIDGVSAFDVLDAFIASFAAFLVFGIPAAYLQHQHQPVQPSDASDKRIDWGRLAIVLLILAGAIVTNITIEFPAAGVWAAIGIGMMIRKPSWQVLRSALQGSIFLLCLVGSASMMPVEELPAPSWQTAFMLGIVSSVFDNIPLTKLALDQMGYDWGMLAYAVGFGGSMIWFGSSAGVALSNTYPHIKSVKRWVQNGWYVMLAYVIGFIVFLLVAGWEPHAPHK